jgi:transposase
MDEQTVHKTFKYKLKPTPEQERALAFVVHRCRELYNAALQERQEGWEKCGVSITAAGQSAQLPEIKEVRHEYRDIHSQVLQDVLTRLDCAFQAFFRRMKNGEKPGYPRFRGSTATSRSPTSNSATAPRSTAASWFSPGSAGLPCAGVAPCRARPRP